MSETERGERERHKSEHNISSRQTHSPLTGLGSFMMCLSTKLNPSLMTTPTPNAIYNQNIKERRLLTVVSGLMRGLTVCRSRRKRTNVANPTRMKIGSRLNQARSIPRKSPGGGWIGNGRGRNEPRTVGDRRESCLRLGTCRLTFYVLDVRESDGHPHGGRAARARTTTTVACHFHVHVPAACLSMRSIIDSDPAKMRGGAK